MNPQMERANFLRALVILPTPITCSVNWGRTKSIWRVTSRRDVWQHEPEREQTGERRSSVNQTRLSSPPSCATARQSNDACRVQREVRGAFCGSSTLFGLERYDWQAARGCNSVAPSTQSKEAASVELLERPRERVNSSMGPRKGARLFRHSRRSLFYPRPHS